MTTPAEQYSAPPDPGPADDLDALTERLRQLKVWAGDPSYETIKARINAAWTTAGRPAGELTRKSTVADCFRPGRRRLNVDLVIAVVEALHPDDDYVALWRQSLRVIGGETEAAAQVRVQSGLPADPLTFTGRAGEIDRLRRSLRDGEAVVISAIEGMAGVGKTQLAIHAGHLLHAERPFERVLFVNLRGFHPDPAQPPARPAAVLDGFLRLLGVPSTQVPQDVAGRSALYRERLAGTRALIVLDNAADAAQVAPLLPATPGCLALVTSRRRLTGLYKTTHLSIDVFSAEEALAFLSRETPGVPAGEDPRAAARIARRCGHLPLALSLVAGHIRATPGWTLTDHADRLDETRHDKHLDAGVALAFDVSYRRLPAGHARLLRLAALHPGQDFDVYAAAALTGDDLAGATAALRDLLADHLLQEAAPGRFTFHDLVHAYATDRARDQDRPADRRAALTRLFDHYLATAAAAMDVLHPAEAQARPRITPPGTPTPALPDTDSALKWLDTERPTLVAVAVEAAAQGWTTHTTRLGRILFRYLAAGHHSDAETVHGQAYEAARQAGDPTGQAHALTDLGVSYLQQGRHERAEELFWRALTNFQQIGDRGGESRALLNLGFVADRLGRYAEAEELGKRAVELNRQIGDQVAEARGLLNLGVIAQRTGHLRESIDYIEQAVSRYRGLGDRYGEGNALVSLGEAELKSDRTDEAAEHLRQALTINRQLGNRTGEADVLDSLGQLHNRLGRPDEARDFYQQSLVIYRQDEDQDGEVWAHNGLGEAHCAAGRLPESVADHTAALALAEQIGNPGQVTRAHVGLGHAHRALKDPEKARHHYALALSLATELGNTDADEIRAYLKSIQ